MPIDYPEGEDNVTFTKEKVNDLKELVTYRFDNSQNNS